KMKSANPEGIIKEIDGVKDDPVEHVPVHVSEEYTGPVMESLGERKGEMIEMVNQGNGHVRIEFKVPSRGMIGYATEFMSLTRGYGILNHTFDSYEPVTAGQVG